MPHRAIIGNDHSTTKTRIVFDASAHYTPELCLNDILEAEPCLLPYLLDILLRFRTGKIAVVADIKQAFLQIEMNENVEYRFTRLVFGLTCSPFLLNATVRHHFIRTHY